MGPPQPLIFMVHGVDQPFNTKEDRSEIARHLSKRYHRQKKLPLNQQTRKPETKVVHYPVTFHHGGQRLDISSTRRPVKKRKVTVKKEEDAQALPNVSKSDPCSTGGPDTKVTQSGRPRKYAAIVQAYPVGGSLQPGDVKHTTTGVTESMCSGLSSQGYYSLPLLSLVSSDSWRGDPFGSLPIQTDGCEPMMIDYFCQQWAPDADLEHRNTDYHEPHRLIVFPIAMNQPVLLQSLVAMCRVFWLRAQGLIWQNDPEYLKLRGRAVALVQAKLQSATFADDATLLAIVCLTSIEMMASNALAVVSHARGLNLILRKRHGEKDETIASRYIKAQARAHVMLAKFIKNRAGLDAARASTSIHQSDQSPLYSTHLPPTYPKHPYSPEICRALATLPVGFSELALTGLLSHECISIINSLSRKTKEWTIICMGAEVDSELKACYHLVEMDGRTNTEYWLFYGLICFCNQFPDKFENRNPFFTIALKCFDEAIEAQHRVTWSANQPWLLWVAIVTTGALEICARPIQSRFVILHAILDQCSNAHNWDWFEAEIRKFLWTDGLGGHWRRCWEEGVRRWQEIRWNSPHYSTVTTTSTLSTATRSASVISTTDASSPQSSASSFSKGSSIESSTIASLLRDSCSLVEANRQSQVQ
ncbi:hypothetical protein DV736_g4492, partial [Chaetothyriales sp. CBS 134916]